MRIFKKTIAEIFFGLKSKVTNLKSLLDDSIVLTANKIKWIALIFMAQIFFLNFDWLYKPTTFKGDTLFLVVFGNGMSSKNVVK